MNNARPLLVSGDAELVDRCARLAAAAGTELQFSADITVDRARWAQAPIVLLDIASVNEPEQFARRAGIVLVTHGSGDSVDPAVWRLAVSIGAEHVACLPDADSWLVERLASCAEEPARDGRVIACIPATGGAGASTLAAACAVNVASSGGSALLIDGDRLGGGVDIVLGGEEAVGVRWPELADTRGRLATTAFRQALPTMSGVSVLSWDREGSPTASLDSWNAVLDAGTRGFDLTVVDLSRDLGSTTSAVLSRAHAVLLVVSARVRGAIAATRMLEELTAVATDIRVVVRERPNGVRPEAIGDILGVPVLGSIPVGAPFVDDGRLPALPEALLHACIDPGINLRTPRAA